MKNVLLPLVIVPAAVLILVTVLRAWLEVASPAGVLTKIASVNVLSLIWTLCAPALMLRKGLSLPQFLLAGLLFYLLHRLAIGTVYAMAWANQWTVAGTTEPVRYVKQVAAGNADATTLQVFLGNTFAPVGFGVVLLFVIWSITWAIGFRGKRPFASASDAAAADASDAARA